MGIDYGLNGQSAVWFSVFAGELAASIAKKPSEYLDTVESCARTAHKMTVRIAQDGVGTVNHRTPTFARTCKRLGIPHTVVGIDTFFQRAAIQAVTGDVS